MINCIWKIIRAQWPIWIVLLISLYTALACEFSCLRFISVSFSVLTVEKINDLAKSISLSYVAGMIFYILSELVPQVQKRSYAQVKLSAMNKNLVITINKFLTIICGKCDEINEKELFYLATGNEYEKEADVLVHKNQLLAFRKLSTSIMQLLDAMLACELYLEMEDFKTLLAFRAENFIQQLNELAQSSEERYLKSEDMLLVFKGLITMKSKLINMNM